MKYALDLTHVPTAEVHRFILTAESRDEAARTAEAIARVFSACAPTEVLVSAVLPTEVGALFQRHGAEVQLPPTRPAVAVVAARVAEMAGYLATQLAHGAREEQDATKERNP